MKIKHVKITKSEKSTYWYSDCIEDEFYVIHDQHDDSRYRHDDSRYRVIRLGEYETSDGFFPNFVSSEYINKDDCEVLEEFDGEVVSNIQTFIRRKSA